MVWEGGEAAGLAPSDPYMRSSHAKPWSQVVALTERQEGPLRRTDLLGLGYHQRQIRRLVLNGRLQVVHPGVYAVGHRAISRRAQFQAAIWWAGDRAALSHESAAAFCGWIRGKHGETRRLPGRVGAGRMQRLIHSDDADARSVMERRSARYFALHGVPEPDGRNVCVYGVLVDCWYQGAKLVVELDSRAHHSRRKELTKDRHRDRALKRHGIHTLRLVWHDLDAGDALAAHDIRQLLGA